MNWLRLPKKVYFKRGSMLVALKEHSQVYHHKKALIITDPNLYKLGKVSPIADYIRKQGVRTAEFFSLYHDPTFDNVRSGIQKMFEFEPDVIVAVGGDSVMSAAKVMWFQYENPDWDLNELADKFGTLDTEETFPEMGQKAKLILIPTTGVGSECSPFAIIRDDNGNKRVIASFEFIPEMTVVDPDFSFSTPVEVRKKVGLHVLARAIEAFTSDNANEYVDGFAVSAVKMVLNNFEAAANGCPDALEQMADASCVSGIALSNSVYTIKPELSVYPTADDKNVSGDKKAKIIELAKICGVEGKADDEIFANWIARCEAIAAL